MRVLLLNGPNLGTLGRRQPEIYGTKTLADLELMLSNRAHQLGVELHCLQSNHEGQLIDWLESQGQSADAIIINPGALSHSSLTLADALRATGKPVIEVHISNVFGRESERRTTVTGAAARAVISGLGLDGYLAALDFLAARSRDETG